MRERRDNQDRSLRLDEVLADYLQRIDRGESVSEAEYIQANPEMADQLRSFFNNEKVFVVPGVAETTDFRNEPTPQNALRVRCPHCHTIVNHAVDREFSDLTCESCGSHFSLVNRSEATNEAETLKKIGRFELIERLGVGGFGTVWKARDTELDRTVAVKIPRRGELTTAEVDKFLREARAAAQLQHSNIVRVHEVGRDGDSVYIVSDFIRGVDLGDWLSGQQLTNREAAELIAKVCDALHHAHKQGVIHRDLKPANIMMDGDGEPHLMDFGLARREVGEVTVTVDGQVLGTPAYMSPEQAQGAAHSADRRSDIYSIGTILFELLTGERPFRGNARMLLHQVIHEPAPIPRKLNANVHRDLETITLKCLEKEPGERYQSAGTLADELSRYLRGEPIKARPIGRVARTWRWCRQNPTAAAAISLFVILSVAGPTSAIIQTQLRRKADLAITKQNQAIQREKTLTEQLRERLYRLDMASAYEAWRLGNTPRVEQLLNPYREQPGKNDLRRFEWHLLNVLSHPQARVLKRHDEDVNQFVPNALAVSPRGELLATGTESGAIILWDITTGMEVQRLLGHSDAVGAVTFTEDGKLLASSSYGSDVIIWDVSAGTELQCLLGHEGAVSAVAFSPNRSMLASGGTDQDVRIWDVANGELINKLSGHTGMVRSIVFLRDGKAVASGSLDDTVRLWSPSTGQQIHILEQPSNVWDLALSPKGNILAVAQSHENEFRLYDVSDVLSVKQESRLHSQHSGALRAVAFAEESKLLATASTDKTIQIWDRSTKRRIDRLRGHALAVAKIAFALDSNKLVSASRDNKIIIWDLEDEARARLHTGGGGYVPGCVRFSPNSKFVAWVNSDGYGGVWKVDPAVLAYPLNEHGMALAIAPDSKKLAIGLHSGTVNILSLETGKQEATVSPHTDVIHDICFSHDGSMLATAAEDGNVRISNMLTGQVLSTHSTHRHGWRGAMELLPADETVVWGNGYGLSAAGFLSGNAKEYIPNHLDAEAIQVVAVSPANDMLAIGCHGGYIKVWRTSGKKPTLIHSLRGSVHHVYGLAFSNDGAILASGGQDKTIRFWDTDTGTATGVLENETGEILSIDFSPNGKYLAASASDGTLRLWHAF